MNTIGSRRLEELNVLLASRTRSLEHQLVHLEMTVTCLPAIFGAEWNASLGRPFADYNTMYNIINKSVINLPREMNGAAHAIVDFMSAILVAIPGITLGYFSANEDNVRFTARCVANRVNQHIGPNTSVEEEEHQVFVEFDNNNGAKSTLNVKRQSNRLNDIYDIMIFDEITTQRFQDQFCALCAEQTNCAMVIGTPNSEVRCALQIADEMKIYRIVEILREQSSDMPSIELSMNQLAVSS